TRLFCGTTSRDWRRRLAIQHLIRNTEPVCGPNRHGSLCRRRLASPFECHLEFWRTLRTPEQYPELEQRGATHRYSLGATNGKAGPDKYGHSRRLWYFL